MKKRAIFWDFDNTLAYRDGKWTRTLMDILHSRGYEHADREGISRVFKTVLPWNRWREPHASYFGQKSWWEAVNYVVSQAVRASGVQENENRELTALFREEYLRLDAWHLFEETERNLKLSVSKEYANVVVSNHTPELEWLASELDIARYFDRILTSALVGYDKPHPKLFEAAESVGDFETVYMIGDNYEADVKGGNKRGYRSILVRGENEQSYDKFSPDLDGIWKYID